ncbi:hypothetical protein [Nakamurella sp.]|uniref:hypothetical protein n=1 Tax=Nakamurella sp. TaxID=1869182 RepID=UPI003B3B0294
MTILTGGVTATALAATVALAGPAAAAPVAGQAVTAQAVASPAAADASGTPKYCARIDKALERRQKLEDRWNGDATTRGSVAWLQAKAQSLSSTNPELSKLLTDVANLRGQIKDPAEGIIADLQAVKQAHCS